MHWDPVAKLKVWRVTDEKEGGKASCFQALESTLGAASFELKVKESSGKHGPEESGGGLVY